MSTLPLDYYADHIQGVQNIIDIELGRWRTVYTTALFERAKDYFQRPGKLIRPLIIVMIANQLGGNMQKAYASSAAIEIYHNASLIFDDIQDSSEIRSEHPAMHISSNLSLAMSIGALVRSLMYHPINNCVEISDQERHIYHRILDSACTQVACGQGLEGLWAFENKWNIEEDEYYQMIAGKTGALFSAAFNLGGICSTNDHYLLKSLRELGLGLGILYQLKNDYLDVFGNASKIKQPLFGDVREGKKTIVILKTLRYMQPSVSIEFKNMLSHAPLDDVQLDWCVRKIKETPVEETLKKEIEGHSNNLISNIKKMNNLPIRLQDELTLLTKFLYQYGT